MAWKPQPLTYMCPQCGWKKPVAPRSDVRLEGFDRFSKCPKCGNMELIARKPSLLELARLGLSWSGR